MLSTAEVSKILNLTPGRVRALVDSGALQAERVGRTFVFNERDVDEFKQKKRGPGRPAKS